MPIGNENTIGLVSANHAIIEIFLKKFKKGQNITETDFDTAKKEFYQTVCIGLHCPALLSKECFGPKQNVEIHDITNIMAAQAELKTAEPITIQTVYTLKCEPEIIGIV